ncbi:LuxR family transcriptional activator of conjugal transfer of Ti plasmids [Pseudorhizobium tarimense]|uniref:LuxR family transcriptional activator of conjugal transfer of Ti plasmids n=1 Tax=Pseudorhizobium tarimense TaxID=1079109 RepID=A0ABV2HE83_9HYPH|nr:autoinducer binding domain-containing protein [Pseudorhizobium tarimense]MCJ8521826.1 autoinducer binding domain-containing protein [Pseudorhizobium tarimense]
MSWDFDSLIDRIVVSLEGRDIRASLRRFAAEHGFAHFAYLSLKTSGAYAVSNYPQEWQRRYLRQRYERIDPVIWMAHHERGLFSWSLANATDGTSDERRHFIEEARTFGICSGISIPLPTGFGHRAIITFAGADDVEDHTNDIDPQEAFVAACIIHAFITVRGGRNHSPAAPKLSPQETVCLKWLAEGKNMPEIAELLGLKWATVRSALDEAKRKLNAVTLPQATALATSLHLI